MPHPPEKPLKGRSAYAPPSALLKAKSSRRLLSGPEGHIRKAPACHDAGPQSPTLHEDPRMPGGFSPSRKRTFVNRSRADRLRHLKTTNPADAVDHPARKKANAGGQKGMFEGQWHPCDDTPPATPRRHKRVTPEAEQVASKHKGMTPASMQAHREGGQPRPAQIVGAPLPPWDEDRTRDPTVGAYAAAPNGAPQRSERVLRRKGTGQLGLTFDEQLVVTDVQKGSAAHDAGIRVGSRIESVGGEAVASQADAVSRFRAGGQQMNIGVAAPTDPALAMSMGAAGSPRRRGALEIESSRQEQRLREQLQKQRRAEVMKSPPRGPGVPGLGPQQGWGDADVFLGGFKPNTSNPSRGARSAKVSRSMSNRTSYEVAWQQGRTEDDGEWRHAVTPGGARSAARDLYHQRNQASDILHHDPTRSDSPNPTRGMTRGAAYPESLRVAARSGAPDPALSEPASRPLTPRGGVRIPQPERKAFNAELLAHDFTVTDAAKSFSPARHARAQRSHTSHGNLVAHGERHMSGGDPAHVRAAASPRGRRMGAADWEAPRQAPKEWVSTPRAQVPRPLPSDIFHIQQYGGCSSPRVGGKSRCNSPIPSRVARGCVPGMDFD